MGKSLIRRAGKVSVISANVFTGLVFSIGSNVTMFDPEQYWFLSLLVMGLPIILLILLLFFLFWVFVRPAWSLISVVFIIAGWNTTKQIIPLRFHSEFVLDKPKGDIRIMSWNVEQFNLWNYKKDPTGLDRMIALINKYDPDIACFQEAVLGDKPTSYNSFGKVMKALNFKYSFFATRTSYTFGHDYGLLLLSKYPIVKKVFRVGGKRDFNSDFQYADLNINGDLVRVYNLHLQSYQFNDSDKDFLSDIPSAQPRSPESFKILSKMKFNSKRKAVQAEFIRKSMDSSNHPILLCGDFNDVPGSFAYEIIGKGLKNAFVEKGYGLSRTYTAISPTLRIDNIFVNPEFKVMQFDRIKKLLSDHYPIVTDIKIK